MLYNLLDGILGLLFRIFFRLRVVGLENIPVSGGAIIASNHISNFDPPLLGVAANRPLHFMAKKELFANPVFAWVITKLNAFPVQRGTADRVAIRKALSVLEQGQVLGIFPEGTRSRTGALGSPEPGVALIAAKSGAPIVPAAIIGTNQVGKSLMPPRFTVIFGSPIYPLEGKSDKEQLEQLSKQMMDAITRLLRQ